jgi:hypothetical protein
MTTLMSLPPAIWTSPRSSETAVSGWSRRSISPNTASSAARSITYAVSPPSPRPVSTARSAVLA